MYEVWQLGWAFPCSWLFRFLIAVMSEEMATSSTKPQFFGVTNVSLISAERVF